MGGQGSLRGRYEAMDKEQNGGRDTKNAAQASKLFRLYEILHFGAHLQAQMGKKQTRIWDWR